MHEFIRTRMMLLTCLLVTTAISSAEASDPTPKLPPSKLKKFTLFSEIVASNFDEGPVPKMPWILVRKGSDGKKMLCGPSDNIGRHSISTNYNEPVFEGNAVFEVKLTAIVPTGQPIYICFRRRPDDPNPIVFTYNHRGEAYVRNGPFLALESKSTRKTYGEPRKLGWNFNGENTVTFVVEPDSVSAYVNGNYFSTAVKTAGDKFSVYNVSYLPEGMGASAVRIWKY